MKKQLLFIMLCLLTSVIQTMEEEALQVPTTRDQQIQKIAEYIAQAKSAELSMLLGTKVILKPSNLGRIYEGTSNNIPIEAEYNPDTATWTIVYPKIRVTKTINLLTGEKTCFKDRTAGINEYR